MRLCKLLFVDAIRKITGSSCYSVFNVFKVNKTHEMYRCIIIRVFLFLCWQPLIIPQASYMWYSYIPVHVSYTLTSKFYLVALNLSKFNFVMVLHISNDFYVFYRVKCAWLCVGFYKCTDDLEKKIHSFHADLLQFYAMVWYAILMIRNEILM